MANSSQGAGPLAQAGVAAKTPTKPVNTRATRETVESIVVAIILAFLFRTFVAEAFVIPTGSMAPTLQGSHKDVQCSQCGYWYRAGASIENLDGAGPSGVVVGTTCPICRYTMPLELQGNPAHVSFTGDRILVSKFAYQMNDPQRWDVIVFKFPGNAKQNYIKRLIGLPGETIRISHGDVYVRAPGSEDFDIQRKPEGKLVPMLQVVDDTSHLADALKKVGWPSRWQPMSLIDQPEQMRAMADDVNGFEIEGSSGDAVWLRYRHFLPTASDWEDVAERLDRGVGTGEEFREGRQWRGSLITDYYAYNDYSKNELAPAHFRDERKSLGLHWVGDLAVEFEAAVKGDDGELLLDLVEGGAHYICRIDVKTGQATLSIEKADWEFAGERAPAGLTPVKGPGVYDIRYSNVDNEVRLWVDGEPVAFDSPTTYNPPASLRPVWDGADDPGDLAPVGIGSRGLDVHVTRARVLRDVYYVATSTEHSFSDDATTDYQGHFPMQTILNTLNRPEQWDKTDLFAVRRRVEFVLEEDEFFPLGDNSPESKDARLWGQPASVDRDLLTGKALLIYWPHSWNSPVPFFPNFERMGLIR